MDFFITILLWGFAALCVMMLLALLADMLLMLPRFIAFAALFLLGLPVYLYITTGWWAAPPCALFCWPGACKILFFMTDYGQAPYQNKDTKKN